MLTAPRRITLYWLLLLLPTLFVGGVAIQLLRREQGRLAEQSAQTVEARRAATAARARLIVENVELLVGDVEEGLLDTLAAEPAGTLDAFLDQWEKNNPLVRVAFRSHADGRVVRPDARTASEEGRGFIRRFPRQFGSPPPWASSPPPPSLSKDFEQQKRQLDESEVRKEVSANVAQVQSARRNVQDLVKSRDYKVASAPLDADAAAAAAPAASALADPRVARSRAAKSKLEADGGAADAMAERTAGQIGRAAGYASQSNSAVPEKKIKLGALASQLKDAAPERRGWLPMTIDGRLHLAGWVQPGGAGEVRGVELELQGLISRLGAALPTEVASGEGYALRDDMGRVLHQVGYVAATGAPASRIPLAAALLPGWDVLGFLSPAAERSAGTPGFFWVSALLVAIFIAAILAGGSLLLWQARRSEEEAVQKTSFVANVSHEFKTPLTTIRLYAELLEQGRVRDAAQGGDYLRTIGRETQRLARLVNNALDFSRLEQGRKKYARDQVDLTAELARLLDTQTPRLAEAGIKLERRLPAKPVAVITDRDALEQIVLNLLDNAVKYAAAGGEVTVALEPRPISTSAGNGATGAEIRVGDRGPAVPPEHRERIFDKFHRVDDALTAEKTGAGLGLSIARQLARGLGGELRYAPREGGGAEFILQLP